MALAATTAIAAGLAASAYLDAKYHLVREVKTIRRIKTAEKHYAKLVKEDRVSPWYTLAEKCRKHSKNQAVWTRNGTYTFGELYDRTTQYANWLLENGVLPGDLVAMYMHNQKEWFPLWFGLLSIGAAPAFINHNLEGKALLHCLGVCNTKLIIVDENADCRARMDAMAGEAEKRGARTIVLDAALKQTISQKAVVVPDDKYRTGMKGDFPFVLIYTSGTTGYPKASAFTIARVHLGTNYDDPAFNCKPGTDVWYNAMPLYHGTGGISCATTLLSGVGVAVAPKFSVSGFWPDIVDSNSTAFVYVGETARYLLNAPPHPLERQHKLRLAFGNGLRPDVWRRLQDRFNIPQIAEFFNSTEGMFVLLVYAQNPYLEACVGHHGLIMRTLLKNTYIPVKVDENGEIWRDPVSGFGQRMPYDEGGEMLVAVPSKEAFQGYWENKDATDKKFARDMFKKGDIYYRSGDALRRTADGHWYFMDRLGDTFRWKSENVSTAEVSECLGKYPGIAEANVYGVALPNHEGRAGCAAIHIDPNTNAEPDWADLLSYARSNLPKYAVPVFIRIVKASSHIHNNKQNKVPLRKEGVDPELLGTLEKEGINDVIMWLPPKGNKYVPFTRKDWVAIQGGQARL